MFIQQLLISGTNILRSFFLFVTHGPAMAKLPVCSNVPRLPLAWAHVRGSRAAKAAERPPPSLRLSYLRGDAGDLAVGLVVGHQQAQLAHHFTLQAVA